MNICKKCHKQFVEHDKYFHGLFIELKAKGGRTSPDQVKMIEALKIRGYQAVICELEEAKTVIRSYFNQGG